MLHLHYCSCQCAKNWVRFTACSQGKKDENKCPGEKWRHTPFSIYLGILFRTLLVWFGWVGKLHVGQFQSCWSNSSDLPFNSSSYSLSAPFNIMTCGWQQRDWLSPNKGRPELNTSIPTVTVNIDQQWEIINVWLVVTCPHPPISFTYLLFCFAT